MADTPSSQYSNDDLECPSQKSYSESNSELGEPEGPSDGDATFDVDELCRKLEAYKASVEEAHAELRRKRGINSAQLFDVAAAAQFNFQLIGCPAAISSKNSPLRSPTNVYREEHPTTASTNAHDRSIPLLSPTRPFGPTSTSSSSAESYFDAPETPLDGQEFYIIDNPECEPRLNSRDRWKSSHSSVKTIVERRQATYYASMRPWVPPGSLLQVKIQPQRSVQLYDDEEGSPPASPTFAPSDWPLPLNINHLPVKQPPQKSVQLRNGIASSPQASPAFAPAEWSSPRVPDHLLIKDQPQRPVQLHDVAAVSPELSRPAASPPSEWTPPLMTDSAVPRSHFSASSSIVTGSPRRSMDNRSMWAPDEDRIRREIEAFTIKDWMSADKLKQLASVASGKEAVHLSWLADIDVVDDEDMDQDQDIRASANSRIQPFPDTEEAEGYENGKSTFREKISIFKSIRKTKTDQIIELYLEMDPQPVKKVVKSTRTWTMRKTQRTGVHVRREALA